VLEVSNSWLLERLDWKINQEIWKREIQSGNQKTGKSGNKKFNHKYTRKSGKMKFNQEYKFNEEIKNY